ncbi:HAMP domain-containing histidine kinase, partial [Salmonella enterica]|nr:HAMP domain-containing histidine kinase [Salmonella enterica]
AGVLGFVGIVRLSEDVADGIRAEAKAFGKVYIQASLIASDGETDVKSRERAIEILRFNEFVPVVIVDDEADTVSDQRNFGTSADRRRAEIKAFFSADSAARAYKSSSRSLSRLAKAAADSAAKARKRADQFSSIAVPDSLIARFKADSAIAAIAAEEAAAIAAAKTSEAGVPVANYSLPYIKTAYDAIPIPDTGQTLYVGESNMVYKIQTLRILEVLLLVAYGALLFLVLRRSFRKERNTEFRILSKEYAHQLGTPLQGVATCIEWLKEAEDPAPVAADLQKNYDRLKQVAGRLERQGNELKMEDEPLNIELAAVADYIRARSGRRTTVQFLAPDGPVSAPHDKVLFQWAVENIAKNAIDAIARRKHDDKAKGLEDVADGRVTITLRDAGSKAEVEIVDNGCGMTPATQARIFDYGFTTKGRLGWGVGLALARRIVAAHGGKLFVARSKPGAGTTFMIVLDRRRHGL